MKVTPYVMFNGDGEEAIRYYENHLGAKRVSLTAHAGTPAEAHVPAEWRDKILHARFQIGDTVIMASDAPPGHQQPAGGYALSLAANDVAEGERYFKALSDGGKSTMPPGPTFFADYFAMVTDRFGVPWIVVCEKRPAA